MAATLEQVKSEVAKRLQSGEIDKDQARAVLERYVSQQKPAAPTHLAGVKSVFESPELSEIFSMPAFKASLGGLLTGNESELAGIIQKQFPDAKITEGTGLVTLPSGTYELTSSSPARFAFDMATFGLGGPMTGGLKSRLGKEAVRAAAVEGAQQAGEEALGGEFDLTDVGMAAGMDVVGGTAGEVLSGIFRGSFGKMTKAAEDTIAQGKKYNVPVMTSDVLPPRTFMQKSAQTLFERIPFLGTGAKRELQQTAREGAFDKLVADFGVTVDMPYDEILLDSLNKVKTARLAQAAKLKRSSSAALSTAGVVPRDNFLSAIEAAIQKEKSFGTKANQQLIQSLEDWKRAPSGDFSFVDGLRSRVGDEIAEYYTGANTQIGKKGAEHLQSIKDALTQDMELFAQSLDNPAMAAALTDWKRGNAMFFDEYSKYKDSALKTMLDKGDLKPEIVMNAIKNKAPSQAKLLYDNLGPKGREAAKGAILLDLLEQTGGNPQKLAAQFNKLDKNMQIFFRGDDKKVIDGFQKLMNETARAQQAGVRTATGQELYPLGLGAIGMYGASTSPAATALAATTAMSGRIFESAPVRNSLLKLANTPVGSTRYDNALRLALNEIEAAAQAYRGNQDITEDSE